VCVWDPRHRVVVVAGPSILRRVARTFHYEEKAVASCFSCRCSCVVVVVVVVCVLAVVGQIYAWSVCETWREIGKSEVKVHCESSGVKIDPELSQ
jgi:hypothetical protein